MIKFLAIVIFVAVFFRYAFAKAHPIVTIIVGLGAIVFAFMYPYAPDGHNILSISPIPGAVLFGAFFGGAAAIDAYGQESRNNVRISPAVPRSKSTNPAPSHSKPIDMGTNPDSLVAEILSHLDNLPEPRQSVLRRKVTSGDLFSTASRIAERFKLSDLESRQFQAVSLSTAIGWSELENLKDDLIVDVGLKYELAIRLQRAFEQEIFTPIQAEVRSIESCDS